MEASWDFRDGCAEPAEASWDFRDGRVKLVRSSRSLRDGPTKLVRSARNLRDGWTERVRSSRDLQDGRSKPLGPSRDLQDGCPESVEPSRGLQDEGSEPGILVVWAGNSRRAVSNGLFGDSWGLSQPSDIDVDAEDAWEDCAGDGDALAAVLDSGVDPDLPDPRRQ